MQDVIIVGGGVIGLSLAYELAGQGVAVTVVDQGPLGQEASWAGAGMLPPGNPECRLSPEASLRGGSHVLWPGLSAALLAETGIDNGFRRCGGLEVVADGFRSHLHAEVNALRAEGVTAELQECEQLLRYEPALNPRLAGGYYLPEMGQVRNPRHLKALMAGCAARGVALVPGTPVDQFDRLHEKIISVRTPQGRLHAGQFVLTAGAWTSRLLCEVNCPAEIRPMRGQMVLLSAQPALLKHVVNVGSRYIVPRGDGRILVGSTEEVAGFDKRNTAGGVGGLLEFARQIVPELERANFERAWAGLRPQSADGLPYLGRIAETENLFVAAGHFRAGLQLSPITAKVVSQLLLGREPSVPLEAFAPDRLRRQSLAGTPTWSAPEVQSIA